MIEVIKVEDCVENMGDYDVPIYNAIIIPTNATNGDMVKAMFPNIDFSEMAITVHASTKVTSNGVKGSISYDFWKDWWKAKYKGAGEIQCISTDEEIAKSFIEDVEAVKDLLPRTEREDKDEHYMPIQSLTCDDITDIIDES